MPAITFCLTSPWDAADPINPTYGTDFTIAVKTHPFHSSVLPSPAEGRTVQLYGGFSVDLYRLWTWGEEHCYLLVFQWTGDESKLLKDVIYPSYVMANFSRHYFCIL